MGVWAGGWGDAPKSYHPMCPRCRLVPDRTPPLAAITAPHVSEVSALAGVVSL